MRKYRGKIFNEFLISAERIIERLRSFPVKVLYGFRWDNGGGSYLNWIVHDVYGLTFDYIIDDYEISQSSRIYRKNILEYLDPQSTCILVATKDNVDGICETGYEYGKNIFDICKLYGLDNIGYFEWIEKKYKVDLIDRSSRYHVQELCIDARDYAVSRGKAFPVVCEYLAQTFPNRKVLDVGAGKGGAIIGLHDFGYTEVDGVEIMPEYCAIAKDNLKKMNIESNILCDNVTSIKLSDYDMFYCYDSFRGKTFSDFISNIESSYIDRPRSIIFVYADPWEHKRVISNGVLSLKCQLDTDWFTRLVNIYQTDV